MSSGCTALFILKVDQEIFIANAGDCCCVLSRKNIKDFIELSVEHKPNN